MTHDGNGNRTYYHGYEGLTPQLRHALTNYMKVKGLSQAKLAREIGTSPRNLAIIFEDGTEYLQARTVQKIAYHIAYDATQLSEDDDLVSDDFNDLVRGLMFVIDGRNEDSCIICQSPHRDRHFTDCAYWVIDEHYRKVDDND